MIERKKKQIMKAFKDIDNKWIESLKDIDNEKEYEIRLNNEQLSLIRDIIADFVFEEGER